MRCKQNMNLDGRHRVVHSVTDIEVPKAGVGQRPGSWEYWKGNALTNASSHLLCRILFG
jgi:hypothetical protein